MLFALALGPLIAIVGYGMKICRHSGRHLGISLSKCLVLAGHFHSEFTQFHLNSKDPLTQL